MPARKVICRKRIRMKNKSIFLLLIPLILFASCQTTKNLDKKDKSEGTANNQPKTEPVYVTNTKKVYLLPPENMAGAVDNIQLLNGSFGDQTFSLLVYFQSDQKGIFMSLLNDFGTDMGNISYDGEKVDYQSSYFPANLKAEYILLDIQNAYYKVESLKSLYEKAGLIFEAEGEDGYLRTIKNGQNLIEEIEITSNSINIKNYLRGYEYNLVKGDE